jgi:hypothetical protein
MPFLRWRAFALLCLELTLILLIVRLFEIEGRNTLFFPMLCLAAGGFAIHAWLPARFRLGFFGLFSLAGICFMLGWPNGALVVGLGLGLIALCRLPVPLLLRVVLLVASGIVLAGLRVDRPAPFWPVLGSMFMFRIIVYLFETRRERTRPPLDLTLAYFFPLPNACFLFFPVLDFQTFRQTYYDEDDCTIYQTGIAWMARGLSHLLLYRFVKYYLLPAPFEVRDLPHLALLMASIYALYLHMSGWFHLITGVLHLFGFNLPRTNHDYFLASSVSDIWRRINIYWKDFMMKVFFFPAFFALRGWGNGLAMTLAALWAFLATWLLHAYQVFWIAGDLPLSGQHALMWLAAGVLVAVNIQLDLRVKTRKLPEDKETGRQGDRETRRQAGIFGLLVSLSPCLLVLRMLGMFTLVSFFFSCWFVPGFIKTALHLPGLSSENLVRDVAGVGGAIAAIVVVGVWVQKGHAWLKRRGVLPLGQSFGGSVALHLAALGVVALAGVPSMPQWLGPTAGDFVAQMRRDMLSPMEAGQLVRGYYEEIAETHVPAGALLAGLALPEAAIPPDYGHYSDAVRSGDDPLLGNELIPGWSGKLALAPAHFNRLGMRDREGITVPKPAGVRRIALVGSSIIMGFGVEDGEVFKGRLEEMLNAERPAGQPRLELLNFGRGRTFSINHLRFIERKVFAFEPDAIYYFAHQDELYSPRQFMAGIVYRLREKKISGYPYPFMEEIVRKAGVSDDTPVESLERMFMPYSREVTLGLYRVLVEQCRQRGIKPVWIYLPMPGIRETPSGADAVVSVAREAGFQVINLADWAGTHGPGEVKLNAADHHPNALGHRLIAERLFAELRKRPELVP